MNRAPARRLVAALVLAVIAALVPVVVASPASAAFYTSEDDASCRSENPNTYHTGEPAARYDIFHSGCHQGLSYDAFASDAAVGYYGAFGFDRNFMYWAPIETRGDVGGSYFGACKTAHDYGTFCPNGPGNVDYDYTTNGVWDGATTAKYWNGAFIAVVCGNMSAARAAGPVPTITGTKFEDRNGNGVRDAGEPGVAGFTIHLYRDGSPVATTTTGADGGYSFRLDAAANPALRAGTYSVSEDMQTGWQQTHAPGGVYVGYGAGDHVFGGLDFGNQKIADLSIVKYADTPTTIAGKETTWRLVVTNHGVWSAPDVVVTDQVNSASYTAITSLDAPCTTTALTITCNLGTLAAGASRTLRFKALSRPELAKGSTASNTATVRTSMPEPHQDDNTSTAVTTLDTRADLSVVKTSDTSRYHGGDAITYTIVAHNAGPSVARQVVVSDPVPAEVRPTSATTTGGGTCTVSAQDVSCSYAALVPGATVTITVAGQVRGDAPPTTSTTTHDHQLTIVKQDRSWSADPGQTVTVTSTCDDGAIATDVTPVVSAVDQGTGTPASVEIRQLRLTGTSTGQLVLVNHATGRAQGHLYLTCLGAHTTENAGHRHDVRIDPLVTRTDHLTAGLHTVTLDAGLDRVATGAGFSITSGSATLAASEETDTGWSLTYDVAAGGADVVSSIRPLVRRVSDAGDPAHSHEVFFAHPAISVTAPAGTSTVKVDCPTFFHGLTATYDLPGVVVGSEAQPITREFTLYNPGTAAVSGTLDLLCVDERTGPAISTTELVTNTATATSATQELTPADNASSVEVVVVKALDTSATGASPRMHVSTFRQSGRTVAGQVSTAGAVRATVVVRDARRQVALLHVRLHRGQQQVRVRVPAGVDARSLVVRAGGRSYPTRVR